MKSYAEAHLQKIAANRMIAFVIWEVGVPRIAGAADQRDTHPRKGAPVAEQRVESLQENIVAILEWLSSAARSIVQYKQIADYQEAQRRAGSSRGACGITKAEQAQMAELQGAQANVRKWNWLAERWSHRVISFEIISSSDWALLQNRWIVREVLVRTTSTSV